MSTAQAEQARRRFGANEVRESPPSLWRSIARRLWGPIPWLLEIALVGEALLGKIVEPVIVGAWLLFSAIVGGVQERRGRSAVDLLREHLSVGARVRRDGRWQLLPARDLVPGDLLRLRPGDLVPADCKVVSGMVEIDTSVLTGESVAVARGRDEVLHAASTVQRGEVLATVVATGAHSHYGRTAELVRSARGQGHLDRLLFAVVRRLVAIDIALTVLLVGAALWRGAELLPMLPYLLVLVTATVPVTMPAAFAVANAIEARHLARRGVLVTGLDAVQDAATMDVLCVDKTGTLTANRQVVSAVEDLLGEGEGAVLAWAAAACDDSTPGALDAAILQAARDRGATLLERESFEPFEPEAKHSAATIRRGGESLRVVLGSPTVVQSLAAPAPGVDARVDALAAGGARVLAVAAGATGGLMLRGLIAVADPPREDAPGLIAALRALGIRVLMVSGDTVATAREVGRAIGLGARIGDVAAAQADPLDYDGFAGFYPEDKFRLVGRLQHAGRVVGMTGDGVNDAPALRLAEVGIAVANATDVAKAAARVVLTRPGLSDVVDVVDAGRRVYRRMLTWTLTKIARTVQLAALVAVGYLATGHFSVSLLQIALLVILNDLVTLTLATDRAAVAAAPESWNVGGITRVAGAIAGAWIVLGLSLLWMALGPLALSADQAQTMMFVYLVWSAQATIHLTRTRGRLWTSTASPAVLAATWGNVVIATLLAYFGVLMAALPAPLIAGLFALVVVVTLALDEAKRIVQPGVLRPDHDVPSARAGI